MVGGAPGTRSASRGMGAVSRCPRDACSVLGHHAQGIRLSPHYSRAVFANNAGEGPEDGEARRTIPDPLPPCVSPNLPGQMYPFLLRRPTSGSWTRVSRFREPLHVRARPRKRGRQKIPKHYPIVDFHGVPHSLRLARPPWHGVCLLPRIRSLDSNPERTGGPSSRRCACGVSREAAGRLVSGAWPCEGRDGAS
jgi:hypothetical protein